MTGGLNELASSLGIDPLVPTTPSEPSFTTIVRTQGRRAGSLAEALASIRAQTYPNHDTVLVVHDADPAVATAVDDALPDSARPGGLQVITAAGGGRSRPLNVGLAAATGDYVCFLDDDDLVTEHWLQAFAEAAATTPGSMIRAVTLSQQWTTDGGEQPVRATGPIERPFAPRFDLLAHVSHNETPLCSVALPRAAMAAFGIAFDEALPVFEDWELFMRVAQLCGVTSIDAETSLYRRLDEGNASETVDESIWHETHGRVIDRLSARPVIVPQGDARRIASAHFVPDAGSRHDADLAVLRAEHDALHAEFDRLTRSPIRMARAFLSQVRRAVRRRRVSD
ncbi:MAG: glycosyltransferase [Actinomycetota bacterium]